MEKRRFVPDLDQKRVQDARVVQVKRLDHLRVLRVVVDQARLQRRAVIEVEAERGKEDTSEHELQVVVVVVRIGVNTRRELSVVSADVAEHVRARLVPDPDRAARPEITTII